MDHKLCLIVAAADNGVIGRGGKMPWNLPAELAYFRARTMGKPLIMGRKTYQSIGKPLPGRRMIVVTRDAAFAADGVTVVHSLDAAVAAALDYAKAEGAPEIMVIGGADIYAQALPRARRVYLTHIGLRPEGDSVFPPLDPALWRLVSAAPLPQIARKETPAAASAVNVIVCIYDRSP